MALRSNSTIRLPRCWSPTTSPYARDLDDHDITKDIHTSSYSMILYDIIWYYMILCGTIRYHMILWYIVHILTYYIYVSSWYSSINHNSSCLQSLTNRIHWPFPSFYLSTKTSKQWNLGFAEANDQVMLVDLRKDGPFKHIFHQPSTSDDFLFFLIVDSNGMCWDHPSSHHFSMRDPLLLGV